MKRILSCVPLAFFLGLCTLVAQAQTAPGCTDTAEPCANFSLNSGFMAASGIAMSNGVAIEADRRIVKHVAIELFNNNLSDPSGAMLTMIYPTAKYSLSHLIRPSAQFDTKPLIIGMGLGAGALKSPTGSMAFAAGLSFTVDYRLPGNMFVRPVDFKLTYSNGLANHFQVLRANTQYGVSFGKYF